MSIVIKNQLKIHRWVVWWMAKKITKKIGVTNYTIGGSYRRKNWWCNDIDLLVPVQSTHQADGIKANLVKLGWVLKREAHEFVFSDQYHLNVDGKVLVLDLFLALPGTLGNALLFTTGPKEFNDKIRTRLLDRGMTWHDPRYFTSIRTGDKVSFESEKEAMFFLDIKSIKPCERSRSGKIS